MPHFGFDCSSSSASASKDGATIASTNRFSLTRKSADARSTGRVKAKTDPNAETGSPDHASASASEIVDAAARGIGEGDAVRMHNALGAVEAHAHVSADTAPGVVFMPFSWWRETTLNGSSANALTPDALSDFGIGSNAFDARVEITRLFGGGPVKAVQCALGRADLQELVGIGVIDPVGGLIIPELACKALRHDLPVAAIGEHGFGIGHLSHAQGPAQTRQDLVGVIVAVVGKDQELIHAQCRVMRDPFQNVGTFVSHCRNDHHGFAVHHRGVFRSKDKVRVAQSYR